ncbi:MAG: amidohydrolase/deacetylase family metallohydrolase, partial [Bacteroidetes bacterium]|nr:amidohydrolase/deacetylase family metallohydrolase [Bacteroidota bacterium]
MSTKTAGISEYIQCQFVQILQGIAAVLVLILVVATAQAQEIDLLLKGGHVIDPKNNINSKMDVAIVGDKIFRVAKDIPANSSKKTVDITGLYITPGLIDMHVHVFHGADVN